MKREVTCYLFICFYLLVCLLAVYTKKKHYASIIITIIVPICDLIPSVTHDFDNIFLIEKVLKLTPWFP
jgi:hypothetical protein